MAKKDVKVKEEKAKDDSELFSDVYGWIEEAKANSSTWAEKANLIDKSMSELLTQIEEVKEGIVTPEPASKYKVETKPETQPLEQEAQKYYHVTNLDVAPLNKLNKEGLKKSPIDDRVYVTNSLEEAQDVIFQGILDSGGSPKIMEVTLTPEQINKLKPDTEAAKPNSFYLEEDVSPKQVGEFSKIESPLEQEAIDSYKKPTQKENN